VAALQRALAPTCKCLRNGEVLAGTESVKLVPGDVVLLRLGDVVPADCYILDDGDFLKIDQSSLTGESIPVDRYPGDEIYSGSIGSCSVFLFEFHGSAYSLLMYSQARRDERHSARDRHEHLLRQGSGSGQQVNQEIAHSHCAQGDCLFLFGLHHLWSCGGAYHRIRDSRQALLGCISPEPSLIEESFLSLP